MTVGFDNDYYREIESFCQGFNQDVREVSTIHISGEDKTVSFYLKTCNTQYKPHEVKFKFDFTETIKLEDI